MIRVATFLLCAGVAAQTVSLTPNPARQGTAVRIETRAAGPVSARLGQRMIRLFPQTDGSKLGLMPLSGIHKTGAQSVDLLDSAGSVVESRALTVRSGGFASQNVQLTTSLSQLKPRPGDAEAMEAFRAIISETRHWAEPFGSPVSGCMISPYGVRRLHNGKSTGNYHSGIDSRGAAGTPVKAVAAGVVRLVRPFEVGGNTVGVDHGQGLLSLYLHLSSFAVADGTVVERGAVIGYVGSTGRSTAPHLHWSIMANGIGVNPAQWISMKSCYANTAPRKSKKK